MPGDPRLRVSDAERDRTVELLREHHAVGRLSVEEYEERMTKVFAARTRGELDELLADLPAIDLYQLPSASIERARAGNLQQRVLPGASAAVAVVAGFGAGLAAGVIFNSVIPLILIIALTVVGIVLARRRRPH